MMKIVCRMKFFFFEVCVFFDEIFFLAVYELASVVKDQEAANALSGLAKSGRQCLESAAAKFDAAARESVAARIWGLSAKEVIDKAAAKVSFRFYC